MEICPIFLKVLVQVIDAFFKKGSGKSVTSIYSWVFHKNGDDSFVARNCKKGSVVNNSKIVSEKEQMGQHTAFQSTNKISNDT